MVRQLIAEAPLTEKSKNTRRKESTHRNMSTSFQQPLGVPGAATPPGLPLSVRNSATIPPSPRRRSTLDASMATSTPPGGRPPEEIFLENLPHIEKVIAQSCRNSKLNPQEAED